MLCGMGKCTVGNVQMRRAVSIVEARRKLGRLADEVRRTGQPVALTRRGRIIARIAPEPVRAVHRGGELGEGLGPLKGSIRIVGGVKAIEREIRKIRRDFAAALDARAESFGRRLKAT